MKGVAYTGAGTLVLRVFDAATAVVLLAGLTVYNYGIYTLALAAYSFWTFLFLPGLLNVIISDTASFRGKDDKHAHALYSVYAYLLLCVGVVLWAVFFFLGPHFAYWVDGHASAIRAISWFFLLSPIETLFGIKVAVMLEFGWSIVFKIIRSTVKLLLLLAATFFGLLTVTTALLSAVLALLFALIVIGAMYRRDSWLTRVGIEDFKLFFHRSVSTHGKWALAEDMFNSLTQGVQPFVIKYFLGAEAVALVALASNLLSYAKSLFPVRDVLFPIFPQSEDRVSFARHASLTMKYATIAYCIIAVCSAIGAPVVTHFLFPKYAQALPVFYILLIGLPFFGVRSVAVPMFYTLKAQRTLFFIIFSRTILAIALMVLLTWRLGIWGAALGMLLMAMITALSYVRELKRLVPELSFSYRDALRFGPEDKQVLGLARGYFIRKIRGLRI